MPSNNPFNLPPKSEALRQKGLALLEQARKAIPPSPPWWKFWSDSESHRSSLFEFILSTRSMLGDFETTKAGYRSSGAYWAFTDLAREQIDWGDVDGAKETLQELAIEPEKYYRSASSRNLSGSVRDLETLWKLLDEIGERKRGLKIVEFAWEEARKLEEAFNQAHALIDVAAQQHKWGRVEAALNALGEAETAANNAEYINPVISARVKLISAYLNMEKPDEAKRVFELITEASERDEALRVFSSHWARKGDIDRALEVSRQISDDETRYSVSDGIAFYAINQNCIAKALAIAADDVPINIRCSIIHRCAISLRRNGETIEGNRLIEQARQAAQEIPDLHSKNAALWSIVISEVLSDAGNDDSATTIYGEIEAEYRRRHEEGYGGLQMLFVMRCIQQGKLEEAQHIIEAIEYPIAKTRQLERLARAQVEGGNVEGAYRTAQQSLPYIEKIGRDREQDPDYYRWRIAEIFWQLGYKDEWRQILGCIGEAHWRKLTLFDAARFQAAQGHIDEAISLMRQTDLSENPYYAPKAFWKAWIFVDLAHAIATALREKRVADSASKEGTQP